MSAKATTQRQAEEALRNAYAYFVEALGTLASEPEAQCEPMGDYNVAWEIKDDVAAGRYLVGSPLLTSSQSECIEQLVDALEAVPKEPLVAVQGRSASLDSMRHPAWAPLRKHAADLCEP